jgi:hypothetical protein
MNLKLLPLLSILLTPIIAACTPEQINEAIEACKGDPACFEIVDEAIEEELAARGITGGRMTNIEMDEVSNILESYTIGDGVNQINTFKINEIFNKISYLDSPDENQILIDSMNNVLNDFYNLNNEMLIPNLIIFQLDLLNLENTQLFYTGSGFNRVKNLIYKVGEGVFNYEIYGNGQYIFNIHLDLETIFLGGKSYISPVSIYNFLNENHPWDSIFVDNQFSINQNGFQTEFFRFETELGVFLENRGFYEYDGCEFVCYAKIPSFGLSYTVKSSDITFSLGAGSGGGYGSFITQFSLFVATPSNTRFLGYDYQSLIFELDETMIGKDLVLEDWLNYALVSNYSESYSQLTSYTQETMVQEFKTIFANYLEQSFVLDPITY